MSTFVNKGMPPPEERFHANVIKMTGLIRQIVVEANKAGYNEVIPFVVDLASNYLKNNYDQKSLIRSFIISSHPPIDPNQPSEHLDHSMWDKILEKDEDFFRNKSFVLFKNLPQAAVDGFKNLSMYVDPKTMKPIINEQDRNEIISYFHAFVKIAIKYIHACRDPYAKQVNGEWDYRYRNNDFPGIDVLAHAKKWKIDLEFPRK